MTCWLPAHASRRFCAPKRSNLHFMFSNWIVVTVVHIGPLGAYHPVLSRLRFDFWKVAGNTMGPPAGIDGGQSWTLEQTHMSVEWPGPHGFKPPTCDTSSIRISPFTRTWARLTFYIAMPSSMWWSKLTVPDTVSSILVSNTASADVAKDPYSCFEHEIALWGPWRPVGEHCDQNSMVSKKTGGESRTFVYTGADLVPDKWPCPQNHVFPFLASRCLKLNVAAIHECNMLYIKQHVGRLDCQHLWQQ